MNVFARKLHYRFRSRRVRKGNRRRRVNPILVCLFLGAFISFSIITFDSAMRPLICALAASRARNIATSVINDAILEKLASENVDYNSIVTLDRAQNGAVTALRTNLAVVNRLKAELTLNVTKRVAQVDSAQIAVPIGSIFNSELLMGRGPKIPVSLLPSGTVEVELKNTFDAAGINQTRHEIILDVKTNISTVTLGHTLTETVQTQIPMAETIIVGAVPLVTNSN